MFYFKLIHLSVYFNTHVTKLIFYIFSSLVLFKVSSLIFSPLSVKPGLKLYVIRGRKGSYSCEDASVSEDTNVLPVLLLTWLLCVL